MFPNSEAVSRPKVFNNPEKTLISLFIILVITSFFRYNIKPQLQIGNKLLTEEQTLYDKIGEIMWQYDMIFLHKTTRSSDQFHGKYKKRQGISAICIEMSE